MRIQKEIANIENIKNRQPIEPLTMEDTVRAHKAAVDRIKKDRKAINKELGIEGIEEKGFTGASKEPKKVSTPELKKMKLSEALFEEAEDEEKQKDIGSSLWAEKDWVAERENARKAGTKLNLDDYSKEEQDALEKKFAEFDSDPIAQAKYNRTKKTKEAEEAEKAEKEKEAKIQKRFDKAGNVIRKTADLPNQLKNTARKLGINFKY